MTLKLVYAGTTHWPVNTTFDDLVKKIGAARRDGKPGRLKIDTNVGRAAFLIGHGIPLVLTDSTGDADDSSFNAPV